MDFNLVVLSGRLAAPPEVRVFESGVCLVRYLLTVRTDEPRRRVDVVPVTLWDPPEDDLAPEPEVGQRVWVVGTVQRRFWSASAGRRSRLEIVAEHVSVKPPDFDTSLVATRTVI
ncbi:MAG: single-stranded DNA-binding protein [Acidimicrobiia bacterium]